jgi:hypothetical protein
MTKKRGGSMTKKPASAGSKRATANAAGKANKKVRPLTDAELLELKDDDLSKVVGGMGASMLMPMGNARLTGNARLIGNIRSMGSTRR